MQYGLYVCATAIGRRINMAAKTNHRHLFGCIGGKRGIDIPIRIGMRIGNTHCL